MSEKSKKVHEITMSLDFYMDMNMASVRILAATLEEKVKENPENVLWLLDELEKVRLQELEENQILHNTQNESLVIGNFVSRRIVDIGVIPEDDTSTESEIVFSVYKDNTEALTEDESETIEMLRFTVASQK
jgi:hypothetical protein